MQIQSLLASRNIIVIFLAVIFVLIVSVVVSNSHGSSKKNDIDNRSFDFAGQTNSVIKDISSSAMSDGHKAPLAGPQSEASAIVWNDSQQQENELQQWFISRGKVDITYSGTYDSYSKATLEAMARNNHDVTAMTFLGIRATDGAEARRWFNMAAIYGSSFSLALAASKSTGISSTEPEDIKRIALIDALMYKKVAELRNDYKSASFASIDLYEMRLGITLTEQDKVIAEEKSHQLYDALEVRRVQLGLGKFDNSVPEVVEAFYRARSLK